MIEAIKALVRLEYTLRVFKDECWPALAARDVQIILDAIEALKPTIENYDIVDGKFVLCPTCGALPCDWGNDLNYRAG